MRNTAVACSIARGFDYGADVLAADHGRRRPRATTTDAEARAQLCLALVGSVKQASEVLSGASWCELGSLRATGRGIILARTTPPDALLWVTSAVFTHVGVRLKV